jgi:hypothetical protein
MLAMNTANTAQVATTHADGKRTAAQTAAIREGLAAAGMACGAGAACESVGRRFKRTFFGAKAGATAGATSATGAVAG